jgi:hypothetical protein
MTDYEKKVQNRLALVRKFDLAGRIERFLGPLAKDQEVGVCLALISILGPDFLDNPDYFGVEKGFKAGISSKMLGKATKKAFKMFEILKGLPGLRKIEELGEAAIRKRLKILEKSHTGIFISCCLRGIFEQMKGFLDKPDSCGVKESLEKIIRMEDRLLVDPLHALWSLTLLLDYFLVTTNVVGE